MTTNQEGRQAAIRDSTSTAYGVAADWHALFDDAGISAGTFNERLLAWINDQLGTSYSNLLGAMAAYAADAGYNAWYSISTLVLGGASTLLSGETDGLAFDFTDSSARIKDTSTPANEYSSTGIVSSGSLVGPSGKLTYTSPSNKLTLQSDGVMRYQAHNLATYSEDFTNWTDYGASPIKTATTIEDDDAANYEGVQKAVTTVAGATYKLVFHITKDAVTNRFPEFSIVGSSAAVRTQINTSTGANFDRISTGGSSAVIDGGTYWELTLTYTADTTSTLLYIFPAATAVVGSTQVAATGSIEVTRTHLYRYPANTDYIRTSASAVYALPLEYSATDGSCLGLLVEEQRTNLCLRSTAISSSAPWIAGGATVTTNAATAPDGTMTASSIVSAGSHSVRQIITGVSSSAAYTFSFYAKDNGSTEAKYRVYDNTNAADIVSNTSYLPSINSSSWSRIDVTFTTPGTCTEIIVYVSSDTTNIANLYVWGAQVELGSFPTSPILTYGAAATRNADNISIATSAFPYNQAASTLYVHVDGNSTAQVANTRYLQLASGLSQRYIEINHNGANPQVYGAGGTMLIASAVSKDQDSLKIAASVATNDGILCVNGTLSSQDTSVTIAETPTEMQFGRQGTSFNWINGYIKAAAYWPRRRADSELQTVTTP